LSAKVRDKILGDRSAMLQALSDLSANLAGKKIDVLAGKKIDVGLNEALRTPDPKDAAKLPKRLLAVRMTRILAVRCLGAVDDLDKLLDALDDSAHPDVRQAAIDVL